MSMAAKWLFSIFSLAATLGPVVMAEDLASCGAARYYPSEYACYDDKVLCPVTFGTATLSCEGTCYDKEQYRCVDGKVKLLPKATGPFVLVAESDNEILNGRVVNACGNYFAIGAGARQCASCRGITDNFACGSYGNQTVFLPNGKMGVDVPGGQYWYLKRDDGNALVYTKGSEEPGVFLAGRNVEVYENGIFSWTDSPQHWLACVRLLPGGVRGNEKAWRFYPPSEENMNRPECEPIKLVAKSVEDAHLGAYKYD